MKTNNQQPGFTEQHLAHYRQHGFAIVENFLSSEELANVQQAVERLLPGWLDYAADPSGSKPPKWDEPQRDRRNVRFPFAADPLNTVTVHPELRRFAATLAGHNELFCEQSDLTYKCQGHYGDVDQQMHMDYVNHTLLYPTLEPAYWQTAYLVYYTDVDASQAPTAVCSWENYAQEIHWPPAHSRDQRPDLYQAETLATVPAGSVLAYSMRTYHRGTSFTAPGARVGQFISYAPKGCPWLGIVGWPEQGVGKAYHRWVEQSTPEERELFGFPAPGHNVWTEDMLRGVAARFPNLDLTPYQLALSTGISDP